MNSLTENIDQRKKKKKEKGKVNREAAMQFGPNQTETKKWTFRETNAKSHGGTTLADIFAETKSNISGSGDLLAIDMSRREIAPGGLIRHWTFQERNSGLPGHLSHTPVIAFINTLTAGSESSG